MMTPIRFMAFDSREALDAALATEVAAALNRGLAARAQAAAALSGGRTPAGFFAQLGEQALDWPRVWLTLVDDRWLPTHHADSNERLLREQLQTHAGRAARLVGLKTGAEQVETGLAEAEQQLSALPDPFDAIVLGMGEDGHTASLFPCAPDVAAALDPANRHRLAVVHPQKAPYPRITLTLAAIASARHLFVHITGTRKKEVFDAAMAPDNPHALPIRQVLEAAQNPCRVYWAP